MRPRQQFTESQKKEVEASLKTARTKEEYQRVQAVWLRVSLDLSADEISRILGIHRASVWRIHSRFFKEGAEIFASDLHGGRYRENLSLSEENSLLTPFIRRAEKSGVMSVSGIKQAYEKELGRKVPKSTIYRVLERNGWRKLAPRPSHPAGDIAAQESFKKTSP